MSQTQRKIIVEECFETPKAAHIAARRGIRVNTCDTHRKAAFRTRRHSMTTVAVLSTEMELPDSYERNEELNKQHAASQRQRASIKKEKRSSSGGARSNFEGDRSNSRGDRDTNARARDNSVAVPTKS